MPAAAVTSTRRKPGSGVDASSGAAGAPEEVRGASRDAHQTVADGVDHQFRRIVNFQRLHQIRAMHGDGVGAQAEDRGDLLVRFPVHDQLQHFEFARGQRRAPSLSSGASPSRGSSTSTPAATCFTASTSSRSTAFLSR